MAKTVNVALIGQGFMGRTHSNAYLKVAKFFTDLPAVPVMHTAFGMVNENCNAFTSRWGWKRCSTDWEKTVRSEDIDLVDIVTPNYMHMEPALAALDARKPVATEKPLAGTLADARQMVEAAKAAGVPTFVWYNYRRCPAVALAHQLVRDGRLGRVYHVRCVYLQDWGGPATPLAWRFQKKLAGSGAHGDLNAHIVDMARFVTGDDIVEVTGAIAETFIKERAIAAAGATGGIIQATEGAASTGPVDVDDAVLFLARFKSGAVASFEATRLATGYKNRNGFEIHGEKGALRFNFEDMNYLDFYDNTEDPRTAAWRHIIVTSGGHHPYVGAWWPDAHILGYEHGFVNQAADIMMVLGGKAPVVPLPDFADAYETQRVLEAALLSAAEGTAIRIADVK
jgi:predicted dehydrogenase